MRVLIACEVSGVTRDAFAAHGHEAWSCDLEPSETPGRHHQGDVLEILADGWDLMICHPPCQHLAVSGARWFGEKNDEQQAAIEFARTLHNAPIPRICLENPKSILSTHLGPPDQILQPWQFGHGEKKLTCLWLKGLLPLRPTRIVEGRVEAVLNAPDSLGRAQRRSRSYPGIAEAMAAQWHEHADRPLVLF